MRIPTGSERPWTLSIRSAPHHTGSGLRSPIRVHVRAVVTDMGCVEPERSMRPRHLACRTFLDPAPIALTAISDQVLSGALRVLKRVSIPVTAPAQSISDPVTNPATGHAYHLFAPSAWYAAQSQVNPPGDNAATFTGEAKRPYTTSRSGLPAATALHYAPGYRLVDFGPNGALRSTSVTRSVGTGSFSYSTEPAIFPAPGQPDAARSKRAVFERSHHLKRHEKSYESPRTRGGASLRDVR